MHVVWMCAGSKCMHILKLQVATVLGFKCVISLCDVYYIFDVVCGLVSCCGRNSRSSAMKRAQTPLFLGKNCRVQLLVMVRCDCYVGLTSKRQLGPERVGKIYIWYFPVEKVTSRRRKDK